MGLAQSELGRRFRSVLWKTPADQEVEDELAFHLEMRAAEYAATGLSPAAARAAALARFGDPRAVAASCRRLARGRDRRFRFGELAAELRLDLRFALVQLARHPLFCLAAVLPLLLGLAATAAVWSLTRAALLRPPPFRQPAGLVRLWLSPSRPGGAAAQGADGIAAGLPASASDFLAWRRLCASCAAVAAVVPSTRNLLGGVPGAPPAQVTAAAVTPDLFHLLGVAAAHGRTFEPPPAGLAAARASARLHQVLLGFDLWRDRFGRDPEVVGSVVGLDGEASTVAGVMPPGFDFPGATQLWTPLVPALLPLQSAANRHYLEVVARLRPGAGPASVEAELGAGEGQPASAPGGWRVRVAPLAGGREGARSAPRLKVLLEWAALLWCMAVASVANLMLGATGPRQREMDIRAALGAGRGRIVRQLMAEGVLVAALAAAGGLVAALGAVAAVRRLGPGTWWPWLAEARVDATTLAVLAGAALLAAVLFALAPGLQLSRPGLFETLRQGGRALLPRESRLRELLAAAEVALATILLIGAGLAARSLLRLRAAGPGFDGARVLMLHVSLTGPAYPPARRRSFFREVEARVRALPGVAGAGAVDAVPLAAAPPLVPFTLLLPRAERGGAREAAAGAGGEEQLAPDWHSVTPGFFAVLGVPLLRGRWLTDADASTTRPVAVIDQTLAERLWPGGDAVGRRLEVTGGAPLTVVGVVGALRAAEVDAAPRPTVFLPYAARPWRLMTLVVRAAGSPAGLAGAVAGAVRASAPDLPVPRAVPLARSLRAAAAAPRLSLLLLGSFAAIALALAASGIYGAIAHAVARHRREIGLRLALGAQRASVLRWLLARGWRAALAGILGGAAAALILARSFAGQLFATSPGDAATYLAAALLLAGAAAAASYAPARRALRIPPAIALTSE